MNKFNKAISPGKFYRVKADPRSVMVGMLTKISKITAIAQTLRFDRSNPRENNTSFRQSLLQLSTGYRLGDYVYRKELVYRRVDGGYTPVVQYMRVPAYTYSPLDELLNSVYNDDPIRILPHESEQTARG